MRVAAWIVLFTGCGPAAVDLPESGKPTLPTDGTSTGFATGPWEDPSDSTPVDDAQYEGAYVRILAPAAGEVVDLDQPYPFEAAVYAADGSALAPTAVHWQASDDPDFDGDALAFTSATLAAGSQDLTVLADLPNGDRVAETIGGVQVQSPFSGTYSGLFSVEGTVQGITIGCTGSATIVVDPLGLGGTGDGSCLVSILGANIPMTWDFSLDSSGPELAGNASVNLVGILKYDLPLTSGSVDPAGAGLSLDYAATIPVIGDLSGSLDAPRISLDTE